MKTSYANVEVGSKPIQTNLTHIANDFENKVNAVWQKVELLKEVKYIENEKERFSVAYRFMEMELEKECKEKESLKQSLKSLVEAFNK